MGDRVGGGIAYCNLGNLYDSLGDVQKAIECYERLFKISKEVGILATPIIVSEIS